MTNVTITLDEETAGWARVHAAERNISVSRLVGEMLRERMLAAGEYDEAMRRYLAKPAVKLGKRGDRYPGRDERNDRVATR